MVDTFKDYVLGQLNRMEGLHCNRMFRHFGLYYHGHWFGIIAGKKLYFRTDRFSRGRYQQQGMRQYHKIDRQLKKFYEVPQAVLFNEWELLQWAYQAATVRDKQSRFVREYS